MLIYWNGMMMKSQKASIKGTIHASARENDCLPLVICFNPRVDYALANRK